MYEDLLWLYDKSVADLVIETRCQWYVTNYPSPDVIQCQLVEGHEGIHEWGHNNVSDGST